MGMMGSIDTIDYDERYALVAMNFGKDGILVYHCIEYKDTLACLFVGTVEDDWKNERVNREKILAFVYDLTNPERTKMEHISVGAFGQSGALIRYK